MIDFERATGNAITFPVIDFERATAISRDVQLPGLKERYANDADFALKIPFLNALYAIIPPERVVEAFKKLCDNDMFLHEAQNVVDYLEDTWIVRSPRKKGKEALNRSMWNCF
ncbi:hypothetical protein QE152_g22559 [Popillia japonica]|uniref:Uncharacterized protein n=1 Tax=Popillia japonica TaxID=7064 RepID=A0AAW1KIC8_POPJA